MLCRKILFLDYTRIYDKLLVTGHVSKMNIRFMSEDNNIIVLNDNGIGFDDFKIGYGLKQMRERVSILGGSIHFENREGFYTKIVFPKIGVKYMIKVMIADDQALIRESLQIILSVYADIDVVSVVGDGIEAMDNIMT